MYMCIFFIAVYLSFPFNVTILSSPTMKSFCLNCFTNRRWRWAAAVSLPLVLLLFLKRHCLICAIFLFFSFSHFSFPCNWLYLTLSAVTKRSKGNHQVQLGNCCIKIIDYWSCFKSTQNSVLCVYDYPINIYVYSRCIYLTGWLAFAPSAIVNLLKQKTFLI